MYGLYGYQEHNAYLQFHRGDLAIVLPEQRRSAIEQNRYVSHSGLLELDVHRVEQRDKHSYYESSGRTHSGIFVTKANRGDSLEECLVGCTCDTLKEMLRLIEVDIPQPCRKKELVAVVLEALPKSKGTLLKMLSSAGKSIVVMFLDAMCSGCETDSEEYGALLKRFESEEHDRPSMRFPFLFIPKYEQDRKRRAYIPPELREVVSLEEVTSALDEREAYEQLERMLFTATIMCGVVDSRDAFACIQEAESNEAGWDSFLSKVRCACDNVKSMDLVEVDGVHYVTMVPFKVARRYSYSEVAEPAYGRALDAPVIRTLAQAHQSFMTRAFSDCQAGHDACEHIYGLSSVRELTRYFDEHIPEQEDDYLFADIMVDKVICMLLLERLSLSEVYLKLAREGWHLAEGTRFAPELTRLVRDVYRTLPRWDLNGWSEQEYVDMLGIPMGISEELLGGSSLKIAS